MNAVSKKLKSPEKSFEAMMFFDFEHAS